MTLKKMKEMARKSYGQKVAGKPVEHIEVVGNKGVTHERPVGNNEKRDRYDDETD